MYNLSNGVYILVILITATPNYHHCLLSSNLGTILLGRKECDITYTYWIILISTLIPTPNVPIYKFQYQSSV